MNTANSKNVTGVLLLRKTFGIHKKRPLYQCITSNPQFSRDTIIVVPYQIEWGFSKKPTNKYVAFSVNAEESNHHDKTISSTKTTKIIATLQHVFGDVDDPVAWNEYQLYYRGLAQNKKKVLPPKIPPPLPQNTIDRCSEFAFTVDNEHTEDFDDAFSLVIGETFARLSIYIADVASRLTAETFAVLARTPPPASIYLSHRRISLLPSAWARECSLDSGAARRAVALDILFTAPSSTGARAIVSVQWIPRVLICVKKHYRYHDVLLENPILAEFVDFTATVFPSLPTMSSTTVVDANKCNANKCTSAESVAHWMEFYCTEAGRHLWTQHQCGIFMHHRGRLFGRGAKEADTESVLLQQPRSLVSRDARYYNYSDDLQSLDSVKEDHQKSRYYAQVTSPIRRWVDIYNQHCLIFGASPPSDGESGNALDLDLAKLNEQMRHIRKLQMDSMLMARFPEISHRQHFTATVIDVFKKGDNKYKYTVFLDELKLISRLTTIVPLDEGKQQHRVRIFIFHDEHSLKKKMKLDIVV